MIKYMEKIENTPDNFLTYNEIIGTLNAINMQYSDESKPMCNIIVFGALIKCYNNKEIYNRVLQYMMDNDLYERYLSVILELQFNPPTKRAELSENGEDSGDKKPANSKDKGGNLATKPNDKNENITELFIRNLFKEDEE